MAEKGSDADLLRDHVREVVHGLIEAGASQPSRAHPSMMVQEPRLRSTQETPRGIHGRDNGAASAAVPPDFTPHRLSEPQPCAPSACYLVHAVAVPVSSI